MNQVPNQQKNVRKRISIAILITAAALMLLISGFQQYEYRRQIRTDLERNAEVELVIKALDIRHSLEKVGLALRNRRWEFEQFLPYPDSLFAVTRRIVEQNPNFDGCCIAMISDYYPEKGRLFEPYTIRRTNVIETYQLAEKEHDYTQNINFLLSVENDSSFWSEPYLDNDNENVTLITYSFPVHDASGRVVGVVGVDLNADWLGKLLNASRLFPSSYHILISGNGKLICGPDEGNNSHQLAEETVAMINDSTRWRTASSTGATTLLSFIDKEDGEKGFVFYATPDNLKPWTIAVVNYYDEVFGPLLKTGWRNLLLTLAGLLILSFIIQRSAHTITKLARANAERERIDSELNIAKKIQMDMLPKTFPPFPERDDIGIFGSLVPAKTVGGDMYDFFIRDEKLFFCIGDVSGKGVPAALVMAKTLSLFRIISTHDSNPSRIMLTINESACLNNESNMFVTFFIGVLDLPTGRLRYCNAGHDRPFVVGKEVRSIEAKPHLPLGVMDDVPYSTQEETLNPDEMLFLYTDGLTEAKNGKHEMFGLKRLNAVLQDTKPADDEMAQRLIDKVQGQVDDFVTDAEQSDDLTLLAIHYTRRQKPIILRESLALLNKVSEITRLTVFMKSVADTLHLNTELANKTRLAVEEAVTNVIEYAYPPGTEGKVCILAEADGSRMWFSITDSGAEFDPTAFGKADTSLNVDERPIGGLGIFLVRNLMDSINYERKDGKNVLRLEKCYESKLSASSKNAQNDPAFQDL